MIRDTVDDTLAVVNTPRSINFDLRQARAALREVAVSPIRAESRQVLEALRARDQEWKCQRVDTPAGKEYLKPSLKPTYYATLLESQARKRPPPIQQP